MNAMARKNRKILAGRGGAEGGEGVQQAAAAQFGQARLRCDLAHVRLGELAWAQHKDDTMDDNMG